MTSHVRPRIAVIGAGVMGSYHARVIAQSDQADLARIIDLDEVVGQKLAERYECEWRAGFDRIDDLQAVVVATPTEFHTKLVLQALAAGLPVLVEKPVSADLAETSRMLDAAEARDIPFMCGFVERFNP